jgi:hypothetical protein
LAFAPGLRIDFRERRVEIDGRVTLRDGMLELFACTAQTREHESVVVVKPRPLRIFEALGLVGLTPGAPTRFDPSTERWTPARGDFVKIEVAWEDDGRRRQSDIGAWMVNFATGKPLPPRAWVFAGSGRDEHEVFAADMEGTVIAVVDFPSALIALPQLHSADNVELWLRANEGAVPERGTEVTLIVTPVDVKRLVLAMDAEGQLRIQGSPDRKHAESSTDGKGDTMPRVIGHVAAFLEKAEFASIEVAPDARTPRPAIERAIESLQVAVGDRAAVVLAASRESADEPSKSDRGDEEGDASSKRGG